MLTNFSMEKLLSPSTAGVAFVVALKWSAFDCVDVVLNTRNKIIHNGIKVEHFSIKNKILRNLDKFERTKYVFGVRSFYMIINSSL